MVRFGRGNRRLTKYAANSTGHTQAELPTSIDLVIIKFRVVVAELLFELGVGEEVAHENCVVSYPIADEVSIGTPFKKEDRTFRHRELRGLTLP